MKTSSTIKIPWNIFDILIVSLLIIVSIVISFLLLSITVRTHNLEFKTFIYIFPLLTIFITYYWLKKKYNISWNILGIRKGNYSFKVQVGIGFIAAISLILMMRYIPFWYEAVLKNESIQINNYIPIILLPFSLSGFARFVLSPLGEEIFLRGFVYGYLRHKSGLMLGILTQALFSTIIHLMYIKDAILTDSFSILGYVIVVNIIFGLLYEKTSSIYPSIICHSMFNYFLFLYFV